MILSLITTFMGFAAPFIPEVIKFLNQRQALAHEREMMGLRLQYGNAEHAWRMEEINTQADIAEAQMLRQPQPSFGVQILDRAKESMSPILWVPVFWAFAFLDFVTGMVRPTIAYCAFGFYMVYRWSCMELLRDATGDMGRLEAAAKVWNENDWAVLMMVLAFYFGERTRKAVFGGSTGTAHAGR